MKNTITSTLKLMAVLCSVLLLNSCGNEEALVAEETQQDEQKVLLSAAQYKSADIQLGKIELRNLSSIIQCNGVLDVPPQNLVSISLPIGGNLKSTELLQGMKVSRGQIIAVFEHPDYVQLQQEYIQAKSTLDFSEIEYQRQTELNKEQVTSQKSFQKTKADYLSQKALVLALEKKLEQLGISVAQMEKGNITNTITITSPINGYVTKVNVNIGKYLNPNDVAFEIVDTEHLHAELTVYEKDITKIKVGQAIRFSLPNENGIERGAKVHLIGREISSDRTVRVHGHLDQEDIELLPGMYIKASIEVGENKTLSLPEKAIVQNAGKNYIFIKMNSENKDEFAFKMIEVAVGVSENGFTEVMLPKDVSPSADVVVNGAYDLLSKLFNSEEE
ncbi:MAG: efflux RND transporter periplasmic adaptor subunit [Flavobacteriales bacterium]